MDIYFREPTDIPLPPKEVRIRELRAEPWPDSRRVRLYLELTPFQKLPSGEIVVLNATGDEVSSASIIETIDPRMELTLHLKGDRLEGEFKVSAIIYYLEEGEENAEEVPPDKRKKLIVAQAETIFTIEG